LDLYLRHPAPMLYLKRLVVGGMERVFEINRNFQNEASSTRHNPEFSMREWYCAPTWTGPYMMDLTERLSHRRQDAFTYQGKEIEIGKPFAPADPRRAPRRIQGIADALLFQAEKHGRRARDARLGLAAALLFERGEKHLIQPTFVTEFPPRSRRFSRRTRLTELADRFELFIDAKEIANGFSELNDPEDQAARFSSRRR
jgi:lysyl-tRNA synthetase class 2